MSRTSKPRHYQNTSHDAPTPVNIGDAETNPSVQDAESRDGSTNTNEQKRNLIKRLVAFITHKDSQPGIANIVSILMFGATIWLAIITLQVFRQTTEQAIQSRRSANAAVTADSLTKISLDSQRAAKKQSDKSDAEKLKRDTNFIKKQTEGIDSQISALKVNQQEFEIENRPFLTATAVSIDTSNKNDIRVNFLLVNTGKRPLIIKESHHQVTFSIYATLDQPTTYQFNGSFVNDELSNQEFKTVIGYGNPTNIIELLRKRIYNTFIFGYFTYQGIDSKRKYFIKFAYKVSLFPKFNVETVRYEYN